MSVNATEVRPSRKAGSGSGQAAMNVIRGGDQRVVCARFARPSWVRGLWQLGNTLAPFALLWSLMAWSVHSRWGHGWTLLLALPAAGLYVRLFIIQHDC